MAETKRRRPRSKQTYKHRKNAICVSVYDPTGATIPAAIRKEIENSVWAVAEKNRYLINIATT